MKKLFKYSVSGFVVLGALFAFSPTYPMEEEKKDINSIIKKLSNGQEPSTKPTELEKTGISPSTFQYALAKTAKDLHEKGEQKEAYEIIKNLPLTMLSDNNIVDNFWDIFFDCYAVENQLENARKVMALVYDHYEVLLPQKGATNEEEIDFLYGAFNNYRLGRDHSIEAQEIVEKLSNLIEKNGYEIKIVERKNDRGIKIKIVKKN